MKVLAEKDSRRKENPVQWSLWLKEMLDEKSPDGTTRFKRGYARICKQVLENAHITTRDTVLDIGTGSGLLSFGALDSVGTEGTVVGCDIEYECLAECNRRRMEKEEGRLSLVQASASELPFHGESFDAVVLRSVLSYVIDKSTSAGEFSRILRSGGWVSIYEPINRHNTRFYELIDLSPLGSLADKVKTVEESIYHDSSDPMMNFDEEDLLQVFRAAGFQDVLYELAQRSREYEMTEDAAKDWWHIDIGGIPVPGRASPYEYFRRHLSTCELNTYVDLFCSQLSGKTVAFRSTQVYMWGQK